MSKFSLFHSHSSYIFCIILHLYVYNDLIMCCCHIEHLCVCTKIFPITCICSSLHIFEIYIYIYLVTEICNCRFWKFVSELGLETFTLFQTVLTVYLNEQLFWKAVAAATTGLYLHVQTVGDIIILLKHKCKYKTKT